MFVLDPTGQGLLLMGSTKALATANWWSIAEVTITAAIGIAAIAVGFQGWAVRKTTTFERVLFIISGFALVYPTTIADVIGITLFAVAAAMQFMRRPPVRAGVQG
jgi:TRAP-type uncharacterized transport system fused permease subunit